MVLMFLGACCTQLVVSSCGGMMGALRVERSKRVACSFYQGGSDWALALSAVFVLVLLHERMKQGTLGLLAGGADCGACTVCPGDSEAGCGGGGGVRQDDAQNMG